MAPTCVSHLAKVPGTCKHPDAVVIEFSDNVLEPGCREERRMKKPQLNFRGYLAALLMLATVPAEAADEKELFAIDLADYPGKEGRVIEVSYPPDAQDMVHRHDAHAFVYVLEGQIIMQLKDQPAVTLRAGQTFYEGPTDVHLVGRNASKTEPARFVVVLLKGKGDSALYTSEGVIPGP
jgi:quercetin dioxygenase-like cupin family protein